MQKIGKFLTALMALFAGQQGYAGSATAADIPCPASDFSAFVRAYADDASVQQAFTQYPLISQTIDTEADMETVVKKLARVQVKFPVIPLSADRKKAGLQLRIQAVKSNTAQVFMHKPDTDFQVTYFFTKDTCWRLVKMKDDSL